MASEKKRILYLFYLLCQSEKTSSSELAAKTGVTERTIKSDINDLKAFALASGAILKSKKGTGYWLEVVDEEIFAPVKEQLFVHFIYTDEGKRQFEKRSNDILRRLLVEDDYIKLDDMVDELYLSRSSIKEEMKEVRHFLEGYNLELIDKPGKGVQVEGTEFNKRLCMVASFEFHHHEAMILYKNGRFREFFECEESEYNQIRRIYLQVLRESEFHYIDECTQRMARYLVLLRNRYQAGYYLNFSKKDRETLRKFKVYSLAEKIIDALKQFGGYDVEEDEVLALEIQLLIWMDMETSATMDSDYGEFSLQARKCCKDIAQEIKVQYGLDFYERPNYEEVMLTALIPIMFQIHFKCQKYNIGNQSILMNDYIRTSPFCVALGYVTRYVMRTRLNTDLASYNYLNIANRFYFLMENIKYDFVPRRVLLCTRNGMEAGKMMKTSIQKRFGENLIEKLDVHELYELRGIPKEQYDFVILCFPYFSYRYEWPYIMIDMIYDHKQMNEVYNVGILAGVQLEPILKEINFKHFYVFRKFQYESKEAFIKLISFKLGEGSDMIRATEEALLKRAKVSVHNKTCILFSTNRNSENFIEIYQLEKNGVWGDFEIDSIILISIYCNGSWQVARFVEHLTHELITDPESIWLLAESENLNHTIDIVKNSLKSSSTSLV